MKVYYITWKRADGTLHSSQTVMARNDVDASAHAAMRAAKTPDISSFDIQR